MKVTTTLCTTCGSELEGSQSAFGPMCMACVLRAGYTPGSAESGPATTWAEVFPQLDVVRTLREEDGFSVYLARVIDQERDDMAILQVASGERLAREGGASALAARARRLAACDVAGLAPVLDFGDLADAYFLVTEAPARLPNLPTAVAGKGAEELSVLLAAIAEGVEKITEAAQAQSLSLRFDPELLFVDEDTGEVVQTPGLLSAGRGNEPATAAVAIAPLAKGSKVGVFQLEETLGEGGFGEVWRARQERPVARTVALKILKVDLHSQRARARFEVEQQALAQLDHPHIASFFDAGTTPDARPYFAMEWIDGQNFTRHCNETEAPLAERLRLFREVCEAIHHAHQKGIIHRDLKPSNVMVSSTGTQPVIKVIDFGIARALEDPSIDQTKLTRVDEIIGTPSTMSPEQAAGAGGGELDARTDIYGLGILLYEVLTSRLPFDPKLPADELRRRIREVNAPKPSDQIEEAAEARRIKGDLDWIVLKCLEKEPGRRYSSAEALIRDLERYADDLPVEAGPPELSYRARKFLRRHRIGLTAAAIVAVALVAGGIASTYGFLAARDERALALEARDAARQEAGVAEAVSRFLSEELLTLEESNGLLAADPRNHDVTLRSVLERASERIEGRFDDAPEVEAVLRRALAASLLAVGEFERAGEHAEQSVQLFEETFGTDDERVLGAMRLLASIRVSEGKPEDAESLLDRIATISGEPRGETPATRLASESAVIQGDLHLDAGRILMAKASYASVLTSDDLPMDARVAALLGISQCSEHLDPRNTALQCHEMGVSFAKKNLGEQHPLTLEGIRRFAFFLGGMPEATAAGTSRFPQMISDTHNLQIKTLGRDHPATLRTRFDHALVIGDLSGFAVEKAKEMEDLIRVAEKIYRPDHPELLRFRLGRAIQHGRADEHQSAADLFAAIIESGTRSVGEHHPIVVDATRLLAEQMAELGRSGEALRLRQLAVRRARGAMPPAARYRRLAVKSLGDQLWSADLLAEVVELFRDEWANSSKILGSEHPITVGYLDRILLSFQHDRTGAAAGMAAELALRNGGTPFATIQSLMQLSLASQMCFRPSLFHRSPVPLPDAYFRLLLLEANMIAIGSAPLLPAHVKAEAPWRFLAIPEGKDAPSGWIDLAFDDGEWRSGSAPLGFGEEQIVTDVRELPGSGEKPISVCFRHRFQAGAVDTAKPLLVRLQCDDGAVILLNGKELLRVNVHEGAVGAESRAMRAIGDSELRDFLVPADLLVQGENVLAARVFQYHPRSSDIFFSLTLHAEAPLPLDRLEDFDPGPGLASLDKWLPDLTQPLEEDWRAQVECTTLACLGKWEDALECSRNRLSADRPAEAAARLQWFQRTALERLSRHDESEDLFRRNLPPRDKAATSAMIDLTSHYNARLDEPWYVVDTGMVHEAVLKNFPTGLGTFDGLGFDVRGIIQLMSAGFEMRGAVRAYPKTVEAIGVNQLVGKLHLLNASLLNDRTGQTVATVIINYEDGQEEQLPIRYWHETLTLLVGTETVPDTAQLGWRGSDPSRPGSDKALYVATWTNPRPEAVVTSIDVRGESGANAALFVVGISIEPPQ